MKVLPSLFVLVIIALSSCVNGEYRQPLGHTVYFPKIEPPHFDSPATTPSRSGGTSHITPDGNGGYTVWNSDGTTQHMVPDGSGGWTVWR